MRTRCEVPLQGPGRWLLPCPLGSLPRLSPSCTEPYQVPPEHPHRGPMGGVIPLPVDQPCEVESPTSPLPAELQIQNLT